MITTADFPLLQQQLYTAVLCDAMDQLGYRNQSPRIAFQAFTGITHMMGRCKTTLWADMYHEDTHPYELELQAVDGCKPGEVLICEAGGSQRSGIWGELLSTAALNSGCVGALVHGAIRDVVRMTEMGFPVFATGKCVYDSLHRQRVIDIDVPVFIDGVVFAPGDLVFSDEDGIVVVPAAIEDQVVQNALSKAKAENLTRKEIKNGMKATEAYQKYGIL